MPVTHGPEPALDMPLEVIGATAADATIAANDPLATSHHFAILAQPTHGHATVDATGHLRACSDGGGSGSDSVTVTVTDSANAARAVDQTFAIAVSDAADAARCDVSADDGMAAGGCCDAGSGAHGSALLALGVLALARRRR